MSAEVAGVQRSLAKKLRQIEQLKAKLSAGAELNAAQLQKLSREAELRRQLGVVMSNGGSGGLERRRPPVAGDGDGEAAATTAPAPDGRRAGLHKRKHVQPGSPGSPGGGSAPPRKKPKRVRGPGAKAARWVQAQANELGPITASMLGRLFQEEFGHSFKQAAGTSLDKWLAHPPVELSVTALKGSERLVSGPDSSRALAAQPGLACTLRDRMRRGGGSVPPFGPGDRVLAVGEGDFTWSRSVAAMGATVVATGLDSADSVLRKYGATASRALSGLTATPGATVLHGVDAAHLAASITAAAAAAAATGGGGGGGARSKKAKQQRRLVAPYDFVVFNFPHTGQDGGLQQSIRSNRKLIKAFARSAHPLLKPTGELHLTLVNRYPYTSWKAAELAELAHAEPGGGALFRFCGCVEFDPALFPDYKHVTTSMDGRDSRYEHEHAHTHVYRPAPAPVAPR